MCERMRTGIQGLSLSLTLLWLVSSRAAIEKGNMEGNATAPERAVHQSLSLCEGEQNYIDRRKKIALKSLNKLGINCTEDCIPHIAFLASGGGERAAVGMVGSLHQMEKDGLLDTLLYLGGVSGSTWSMSSLYSDPEWSINMDRAVSNLSAVGVKFEQALAWLAKEAEEESFSLSDVWGVLTSAGIMKQMDQRRLSDETSYNATNPYPVYSAIEKACFSNGPIEGQWFEVSPHEAGFTELGLFIETSLLGSRFQEGVVMEKKPEMDMIKLQGLLGCALAHEELVAEYIPPWLHVPRHVDTTADQYIRLYNSIDKMLVLIMGRVEDPAALSSLNQLKETLSVMFHTDHTALLESKTAAERASLFQQWTLQLLAAVKTWSGSLEEGPFKTHVALVSRKMLPLIVKWEWGTTSNFLYQYQDFMVPPCLYTAEHFHLIDAGMLINVGYPPFLGDKRDIDLIIAPEYSAGNMFETLTLARKYALEAKRDFPKIDDKILEDKEWPKDCYVLEGKNKEPTIIYMPLFNRQNCKDAAQFAARMQEFSTFQLPFNDQMIQFVLETARTNVRNNRETLLREINKAVLRRQSKSQTQIKTKS